MSDWLNAIERQLRQDPNSEHFLKWLENRLSEATEPGRDCYEAASWLGANLHLELAAAVYVKGAQHFKEQGESSYTFACLANAGLYNHKIGQYLIALELYEQADGLRKNWEDSWHFSQIQAEIVLWLNACDTLVELRKHSEALDKYLHLRILCQEESDTESEIRCFLGEGNIYRNMGRFRLSLRAYQSAHELGMQVELPQQIARASHGMGNIFLEVNQTRKAIEAFEQALQQYEWAEDLQGAIEAKILIGHSYQSLVEREANKDPSNWEEEQRHFLGLAKQQYEIAYRNSLESDPINAVDVQLKLASLAELMGQHEHAKQLYGTVLENPLVERDYFTARQVWQGIGEIYVKEKDFESALACYLKALELSKNAGDKDGEADFHTLLGYVYEETREVEVAIRSYQTSIALQKQLGVDLEEEEHQLGYFGLRVNVFGQLVALLLRQKKEDQAFNYLEQSKAKAMRDQLARKHQGDAGLKALRWEEVLEFL